MRCGNCGAELPVGSSFCTECGGMVSFSAADDMNMQYYAETPSDMGDPYMMGGAPSPKQSKINNKVLLIVAAVVLVLILVLVIVFVTNKNKRAESEEDQMKQAVDVAEKFSPDLYDAYKEAWKDADEGPLEDFMDDYYPSDFHKRVEKEIFGKEIADLDLDELKEHDPDYIETMWIDKTESKVDCGDASVLTEEELADFKDELADAFDEEIEIQWGCKVEVEEDNEFQGEESEFEGFYYILSIDDKVAMYATKEEGERMKYYF